MYPISPGLLEYLKATLQGPGEEPRALVRFTRPDGEKLVADRVISVDLDRRMDSLAAECAIRLENPGGFLSPDYAPWKFGGEPSPWQGVLWPNTACEVWLGYGDHLVPVFWGWVGSVEITAAPDTIEVRCLDACKRLLEEMVEPDPGQYAICYPAAGQQPWVASDIVADLVNRAGLVAEVEPTWVIENGQKVPYVVPFFKAEMTETWADAIGRLLETLYHRLYATRYGTIRLERIRDVDQATVPDHEYHEAVDLTGLTYRIDDANVRNKVLVSGPGGAEWYTNDYLLNTVCRGRPRRAGIEVPWADTPAKRELAARSLFRQIARKFRTMTFGAVGNPALDLGDVCRITERVSTARMKYQVVGIRTTFSADQGYFDVIDLEFVA